MGSVRSMFVRFSAKNLHHQSAPNRFRLPPRSSPETSFELLASWQTKMGVSGTPKSSILIGFCIINHPFWGTPIFGNTQMWMTSYTGPYQALAILSSWSHVKISHLRKCWMWIIIQDSNHYCKYWGSGSMMRDGPPQKKTCSQGIVTLMFFVLTLVTTWPSMYRFMKYLDFHSFPIHRTTAFFHGKIRNI